MKLNLLILVVVTLLICSVLTACGGTAVSVEGTWYSVVDTTMYNFSDGEITVSGVTVGQYEDNKNSVVISLMADGTNLKLYITKIDNVDVLADVKEGTGRIYFCKGLENAQAILEKTILSNFISYLSENLMGTWKIWDPNEEDGMEFVDFVDNELIKVTQEGGRVIDCPVSKIEYGVAEGEPYAKFWYSWPGVENPISSIFTPAFDDYMETNELYMDGHRWLQKVE